MIYLHGFASGATSTKATYLARRFREHGIEMQTPDLNLPDFSTLTITRMLEQTRALLDASPAPQTVIGSSLGGFVGVQAALQRPDRVERLVLLAPALDFGGNGMRQIGGVGLEHWRTTGSLNVFHYGYGRMIPVHYELYADARRYDSFNASIAMPVQVFQGRRDTAVDPETVERWSASRPNVELHMLDDDHQLLGSLDYIWGKMEPFLGLRRG